MAFFPAVSSVALAASITASTTASPAASLGAPLVESLGCGACHLGFADPRVAIAATPSLAGVGDRFSTEQLIAFLADTPVTTKPTRMPDYGFNPEEAAAIAAHLLDKDSAIAKRGADLFTAQRCAACHAGQREPIVAAPFINSERRRVTNRWLKEFLTQPTPVRPLGHPVGSGGRMPDFRLSPTEVDSVFAAFNAPPADATEELGAGGGLSPYAMHKAQRLISEKFSCLGCHQLGGEGGRVGPDLSNLRQRLRPSYVAAIIQDPQATAPGTIMPRQQLAKRYLELVTDFLNQQTLPSSASTVTTHASLLPADSHSAYAQYCAVCHGPDGAGDGPNAAFLKPRPASLADATTIAQRPDDTLYDVIHAGGRILEVSVHMPAWGETLSAEQIHELVQRVRELCDCVGPLWSRDHKQQVSQ